MDFVANNRRVNRIADDAPRLTHARGKCQFKSDANFRVATHEELERKEVCRVPKSFQVGELARENLIQAQKAIPQLR